MPRTVDWLYQRKSCDACKDATAFLDAHKITVRETTDATRVRISPAEALKLARQAESVYARRGSAKVNIRLVDNPSDDDLTKALIGPSGNLKAPTIRVGRTLVVGFREDQYARLFG